MHLLAHLVIPLLVAVAWYRPRWRSAALLLLATMAVDVDHLLAVPIYDPERCSIGFHPLHTVPAMLVYLGMALTPWLRGPRGRGRAPRRGGREVIHLLGVGLLLHMALDALDCVM